MKKKETPGLRVAFPTDEHYPYENKRAIELARQIVRDFDPNILVTGSDGVDFYSISRFDKDPLRAKDVNLQHEIDRWREGQEAWRKAAPNAKRYWIPGNHEERLSKYLWRHARELALLDAMRLENVLGLKDLGLEMVDEVDLGALVVKHGTVVRKSSAYSARGELEKEFFSVTTWSGHTHRGGVSYARTRNGVVAAYEGFCLCDLEPEYARFPDWQNGILLGTVYPEFVHTEPIPFYPAGDELFASWRGKIYRA